jgi:hypothetical protein
MGVVLGYFGLLAVSLCLALLGRLQQPRPRAAAPSSRWLVLPGQIAAPIDTAASLTVGPAAHAVSRDWGRTAGYALTIASVSLFAAAAAPAEAFARTASGPAVRQAEAPMAWLALGAAFDFDRLGAASERMIHEPQPTLSSSAPEPFWLAEPDPIQTAWVLAPAADHLVV